MERCINKIDQLSLHCCQLTCHTFLQNDNYEPIKINIKEGLTKEAC